MHAAANRSETRARPERILAAADESGDELRRRFDSALPFRHLVLDSFFEPDFAERLIEAFPSFDERLAMNENGEVGAKCVHQRLPDLGPPWRELDDIVRSPDFLEWLGAVTGIPGLRYDPDYFGGGTHENRHGQELDPHVDFNRHPTTGLHRRLNLIVYLNREWDDAWGGAIDFHADPHLPQDEVRSVTPRFNRAVLFETTRWSWHGFRRIDLPEGDADPRSRKSVALYFYTSERPAHENVKPHSTIYVERPMPGHIRPGEVLDPADHETLRRMLARRDRHLQRLYDEISDLHARIDDLVTMTRPLARARRVLGRIRRKLIGRDGT